MQNLFPCLQDVLLCLLKCILFFYIRSFKFDEKRSPVYHIVEETFPHLFITSLSRLSTRHWMLQIWSSLFVKYLVIHICSFLDGEICSLTLYMGFHSRWFLVGYHCSHFMICLNSFWINCKYLSWTIVQVTISWKV